MDANFYKQLCEQEDNLQRLLDAIRLLKSNYKGEGNTAIKSGFALQGSLSKEPKTENEKNVNTAYHKAIENPPREFKDAVTHIQKVVFALNSIKIGVKDDVADFIIKHEKSSDRTLVVAYCGNICSRLYRLGLIDAKSNGLKNVYSIKK